MSVPHTTGVGPVDGPTSYSIKAIQTHYRGCQFRSRLEARWAVFFDHLDIGWRYEPEGFLINGQPYLPDFLLECGTWVEVKPVESLLDKTQLRLAALGLPPTPATGERGPRLLILGPHPLAYEPVVDARDGDWGWLGLEPDGRGAEVFTGTYGFGQFGRRRRPWFWEERSVEEPWLQAVFDSSGPDTQAAYAAANGARFEHGERGFLR